MEAAPDFDAGEVARTVALAVSNLHNRSQSSDSGNDETPLVRDKRRQNNAMSINADFDPDDKDNLIHTSKWRRYVPMRHVLSFLGFLGFCNVYALRVNLSVALVAMINETAIYANKTHSYECGGNVTDVDLKEGEFDWSPSTQANILGSFFYGYLVTQVPGGRLAERFGGKWLFGGGVLCTSLLTLLTPLAARAGVAPLIALRVLEGLGEGVTFPAMHAIIGVWLPRLERSSLATLIYSGAQIGTVVAMPLSGILCDSQFLGGWPSVFYVFGFLGCLWFVLWAFLIYETPEKHPYISKTELLLIQSGRTEDISKGKNIPWRAILCSVPVWTLMVTHFGQNWGFYTFLTELPTYLSTILHYKMGNTGFLSALPYLLQAIVGWSTGFVADRLRQRQVLSISAIRKVMNTIGFFGPALCLVGVVLVGCNHFWGVFFLTLAMGFNGCTYSGYMVTHVDMAPHLAGTLMGMTNAFATLTGFLAPLAVGKLTDDNQTLGQWHIVFFIAIFIYFLTGTLFIACGSAKPQKWGEEEREGHHPPSRAEKTSDLTK
ncbi:sialin-like [Uloborus diversus]|uniref:sialin-like n=1 Tax=Uloborus diversus TaxID=327109 RepID=UPI00240A0F6A|nr:sialin-like [Uloborus diversus]